MKQLFLIALLCGSFIGLTHAQTEAGTILLGGGIFFKTSDGSSSFDASPNVGIFVMHDVAVSATFQLLAETGKTNWALGPNIRLYLFGNDRGKFITQIGVNVGGAKNSDTDFGFEFGAGYAAFLNKSIAIDFLARYTKTGDVKAIFVLGAGFQIHFKK